MNMPESALMLMMNSLLLMLRIAPGESFPKPLSRGRSRNIWSTGERISAKLQVRHPAGRERGVSLQPCYRLNQKEQASRPLHTY
jgi:hypothetical protein